jgi:hypothetical protein
MLQLHVLVKPLLHGFSLLTLAIICLLIRSVQPGTLINGHDQWQSDSTFSSHTSSGTLHGVLYSSCLQAGPTPGTGSWGSIHCVAPA